jgi:hypothetical protein
MTDFFLKELKDRLSQVLLLDKIEIHKFYDELLSFFSETQIEYVHRRYNELKKEGYKNIEIYEIIAKSIHQMLFRGKTLSQRQIKRIIYKEE